MQVTVGGRTVDLKEAETPSEVLLLPGRYDIEAVCTNNVLGETFSTQIKNCELTQFNNYWYINLEYTTICLEDIGWEVSSLTVNGKDYGQVEFDSWGEMNLFPLPEEGEIVVTYDGITLSDSYVWSGGYTWEYFYPEPTLSEETARDMMDQVGAFLRGLVDAYNSGDMTEWTTNLADSPVVSYYAQELEEAQNPDNDYREVYHYTLREMQGDLNWSRDYSDGDLCFSTLVFLGLDYSYEVYWNGELEEAPDETYPYDNMMRIYVQWINGQWTVTDLQWANYYSTNDMGNPYTM